MRAELLKTFSEELDENPLELDLSEFVDFTGWVHEKVEELTKQENEI